MGIHTANLEPPKAIVVGSDRARLEPILAALTTAGYTAMALAYDDDLGASALAQAADLAVFAHEGGNTTILASFRRLRQRPALAIIEPDGVVFTAGFGSLARGPHAPDALPALLREHLGVEPVAALPEAPPLPETPDTPAPEAPPLPEKSDTPAPVQAAPKPPPVRPSGAAPPGSAPTGTAPSARPPVRSQLIRLPAETTKALPRVPSPATRPRGNRAMVALVVLVALAGIVIGGFMVAGALRPRVDPSATAIAGDPLLTVTPAPMTPMADTPIPSSIPAATAGISASNLEVQIMAVSPNQPHIGDVVNVRVRVRNVSGKVISDSFWVDLYVSPTGAPTALVPWSEIAAYGATWRVTGLGPGESRDLNSLDADPTRSNLLRLNTPGTYQLYVLADTLNELPVDLSSGTARPIYLGGPTEVMVGNASTPP